MNAAQYREMMFNMSALEQAICSSFAAFQALAVAAACDATVDVAPASLRPTVLADNAATVRPGKAA